MTVSLLSATCAALDARSRLVVTTGPATEPVCVDDIKAYLRIDHNDDDQLLSGYIQSARDIIEKDCERALITQTLKLYLDSFPSHEIQLRRCPVQSISSIQYYDTSRTLQTLSSAYYTLDANTEPARVYENYGYSWPSTADIENAVIITFVAGYGDSSSVPQLAKQAIACLVMSWMDDCDTSKKENAEMAYDRLIARLRWGGAV